MKRLALLCSGQGFQHRDMFALTGEADAAAPVFAAAATALGGRDPRALVQEDDQATHDNAVAQILCCTQALAAAAMLQDQIAGLELIVAGYSVGELAAWGVAGVFGPEAILTLAARRAHVMDEAADRGGLAAIRGLPRHRIDDLCAVHETHVAIINGADQIVIGGRLDALDAACRDAEGVGAGKITKLAVHVPSHTPLLADAVAPLGKALHAANAHVLSQNCRLLSGIDGQAVFSIDDGLDKLARQVAQAVDWQACMDACQAAGAARALELGPGGALAKLMAERLGARDSRSIEDFRSKDGVCRWLEAR